MRSRRRPRASAPVLERLVPVPGAVRPAGPVADLTGCGPSGEPVRVGFGRGAPRTLLLFLSTDCDGCRPFWSAATGPPAALGLRAEDRVVVVTRDPGREDPSAVARSAPGATVVMSSAAWDDLRVSGPPFYALVGPDGREVATEGVAWAVEQVAGEVERAAGAG